MVRVGLDVLYTFGRRVLAELSRVEGRAIIGSVGGGLAKVCVDVIDGLQHGFCSRARNDLGCRESALAASSTTTACF